MEEIIIYFSRKGNNYVNGKIINLSIGNTAVAAQMIQEITDATIFKIEPIVSYSHDYTECTNEAKRDMQQDARPELKSYPEALAQYHTIYLGYPNYWGTMPMAVFTFLERYNFSGKVIMPFCTHEGSGMGSSVCDIKKIAKGASVGTGLAIHGAEVESAKVAIRSWLDRNKRG
ncbi:flavodoxin [Clostridium sp. KNHs205]|uniref:flavodoxin n=1 Tax=Clostridium sp. KNHs205 TaxID=1449050 RepID=UPI00051BA283|nr:flavodoxin [Clostridium sp. KNHs205]